MVCLWVLKRQQKTGHGYANRKGLTACVCAWTFARWWPRIWNVTRWLILTAHFCASLLVLRSRTNFVPYFFRCFCWNDRAKSAWSLFCIRVFWLGQIHLYHIWDDERWEVCLCSSEYVGMMSNFRMNEIIGHSGDWLPIVWGKKLWRKITNVVSLAGKYSEYFNSKDKKLNNFCKSRKIWRQSISLLLVENNMLK